MEQRNLIVGYDFNNDYTGISCINPKTFEPESICVGKNDEKYLIPTVIGITKGTKEWVYGEEALLLEKEKKAMVVHDLLDKVEAGDDIYLYDTLLSVDVILEKFMRKTFLLLKPYYPSNTIEKVVVSVHKLNTEMVQAVYKALKSLGIESDRAFVLSHDESYQCYALSQPKELWNNNVGVFYFNKEGLYYSQLNVVPYQIVAHKSEKKYTYVVSSKEEDYTSILSYAMLSTESKERLLSLFINIAKSCLHKQVVSTLYITGEGFADDWVNEGLLELCNGRRVFKGNNLYSRGAAFAAREHTKHRQLQEFYRIGKDMIKQSVSFVGYKYGSIQDIVVLDGDKKWYEVEECFYVILDEEEQLTFKLKDVFKKEEQIIKLPLLGLPKRENKTVKLRVRIFSYGRDSIIIQAKDVGFGSKYPSTHRVWETEIIF